MKAWGKLAGAFNKKHLLMHLKWGGGCAECVRTLTLQEAGSFVISHIYTGVSINAVLQKSFFENGTLEEKHRSLGLINDHHGDARLCVELVLLEVQLANPGSPSSRLRPSQQPLPPVLHPPPLRVWGEAEDQMALEVQAASWTQHPPHPQPHCYIPGHTSTLWPPPPLPQSKPLSPSACQCCMTGQTQSFTKMHPMSLLCSCLSSQENRSA